MQNIQKEEKHLAIRIDEVLQLDSFQGSRVIAGASGLHHFISNLHTLEITDILTDIAPETLVFSTLYPVLNNEAQVTNIIQRLYDMGVKALALKLNRQGERVPDTILKQADELALPILLLPSGGNFSLQNNEILKYQLESNLKELHERDRIHNLLLDIMLKRQEYDILRDTLAEVTGYRIALLDARFSPLPDTAAEGENSPSPNGLSEWDRKNLSHSTGEPFRFFQLEDHYLCIYIVRNHWETIGYISLESDKELSLSAFERMAVEQFATVFVIIYHRQNALNEMEKRYHDEFLFDLIGGKIPSESDAAARAKRLNWRLAFPAVMVGVSLPGADRRRFLEGVKSRQEGLRIRYGASHDVLLMATYEDNVLVLVSNPHTSHLEELIAFLEAVLRDNHFQQYYIGVSLNFDQMSEAAKACGEAKLSLRVARDLQTQSAVFYEKLGIYRLIHSTENRAEIYRYCMDTLGSLFAYDQDHETDLYATLKVLLEEDGNLKAAAQKMYIHYNTMRNRVQKIESLLGRKLTRLSSYQDVYIAVRIHEMFSPNGYGY